MASIIDHRLQQLNLPVPLWLRDKKLKFGELYYLNKRLDDFEKFKVWFSATAPFRNRNVFLDIKGLERI